MTIVSLAVLVLTNAPLVQSLKVKSTLSTPSSALSVALALMFAPLRLSIREHNLTSSERFMRSQRSAALRPAFIHQPYADTMIRQCAILFGCLALGELVVWLTGVKLPSSIIGMLLLTTFLKLGWIKLHWVQGMSDFLVANLGFFFVPPGVALMLYFDIIAAQFWPIVIASAVSTILVLVVTGWIHQLTRRHL